MEAVHNLLRRRVHEHHRKLDDLVQIGPRVLFAGALKVQHTNDSRGGSNWWWWRRRRSWSLSLFASLASSGLDSRQSGAFWGECCDCCRGDECEAHVVLTLHSSIDVRALILQACPESLNFVVGASAYVAALFGACCSGLLLTHSHASIACSWWCAG